MPDLAIEMRPVTALRPWARDARTHSRKQVRQIADSIQTFGFTNPVLIDATDVILAGHGRVEAARLLGMDPGPLRAAGAHDAGAEARLRPRR